MKGKKQGNWRGEQKGEKCRGRKGRRELAEDEKKEMEEERRIKEKESKVGEERGAT